MHTSVKLKKRPMEPETLKALSIVSSYLGKHGEQAQSSSEPG